MAALLTLLIIICIFGSLFIGVYYGTYLSQTKDDCHVWKRGSFEQFKRNMETITWERQNEFPRSFFGAGHAHGYHYVHADIVRFKGVGFIMNPIDYVRYCFYVRKHVYRGNAVNVNTNMTLEQYNKNRFSRKTTVKYNPNTDRFDKI